MEVIKKLHMVDWDIAQINHTPSYNGDIIILTNIF